MEKSESRQCPTHRGKIHPKASFQATRPHKLRIKLKITLQIEDVEYGSNQRALEPTRSPQRPRHGLRCFHALLCCCRGISLSFLRIPPPHAAHTHPTTTNTTAAARVRRRIGIPFQEALRRVDPVADRSRSFSRIFTVGRSQPGGCTVTVSRTLTATATVSVGHGNDHGQPHVHIHVHGRGQPRFHGHGHGYGQRPPAAAWGSGVGVGVVGVSWACDRWPCGRREKREREREREACDRCPCRPWLQKRGREREGGRERQRDRHRERDREKESE